MFLSQTYYVQTEKKLFNSKNTNPTVINIFKNCLEQTDKKYQKVLNMRATVKLFLHNWLSTNFKFKVVCTQSKPVLNLRMYPLAILNISLLCLKILFCRYWFVKLCNFYCKLFICRKLFSRFGLIKGFHFNQTTNLYGS